MTNYKSSQLQIFIHTGACFFRRFCEDNKITLLHPNEIERLLDEPIDSDKWLAHVKSSIIAVNGKLLSDRGLLVLVECQTFYTHTDPPRKFSVLVSMPIY